MKKRFRFLEHTADVGMKAYGDGLEQCFEHAALGMFELLFGESAVEEVGEYEVMLEADNLEQLLVDWLSEILYLHEADELAFKSCSVKLDGCKLDARLRGEALSGRAAPHYSGRYNADHAIEPRSTNARTWCS